jgi:hypothetical protein
MTTAEPAAWKSIDVQFEPCWWRLRGGSPVLLNYWIGSSSIRGGICSSHARSAGSIHTCFELSHADFNADTSGSTQANDLPLESSLFPCIQLTTSLPTAWSDQPKSPNAPTSQDLSFFDASYTCITPSLTLERQADM